MVLWVLPYKPFPKYLVLLGLEWQKHVDQWKKAAPSLVLFPFFDTHLPTAVYVLPSPKAVAVPWTNHFIWTQYSRMNINSKRRRKGWGRKIKKRRGITTTVIVMWAWESLFHSLSGISVFGFYIFGVCFSLRRHFLDMTSFEDRSSGL